jgi:hypothetical protein
VVDLVNTDQIGSKVGYDQEVAGWIHESMMRVGSFLSVRVHTFTSVLDCLKRLSASQRQFEGRQLRSLAVD